MQFLAMALKTQAINRRWPSRKALVAKTPSRGHSNGGVLKPRNTVRMKEDLLQSTSRSPQELSLEQLEQAKLLANIVPGQQRPSAELLGKMMEKHTATFRSPVIASSPPHPLRSLAEVFETSPSLTTQSFEIPALPAWEVKALKVIKVKELSMDTDWAIGTWRQKTSREVRLKLLKDDGYDITPLQAKGVSSDQITAVLLDRMEAHRKRRVAAVASIAKQQGSFQSCDDEEFLLLVGMGGPDMTSNVDATEESGQLRSEFMNAVIPERQTRQSFSPPPMTPQKRKHDHEDDVKGYEESRHCFHDIASPPPCSCGPDSKKIRTSTPEELKKEVEAKAFDQLNKEISRDIFRSPKAPAQTSRIIFRPNNPSPKPRAVADVHMGSRGFGRIMEELEWLGIRGEDGVLQIHKVKESKEDFENFISVFKDFQHRIVVEGDSQALVGMVKRLQKQGLMHTSTWIFDGMQVVCQDNIKWSLSQDTMDALANTETLLVDGAVEVVVEEVYSGKWLYVG